MKNVKENYIETFENYEEFENYYNENFDEIHVLQGNECLDGVFYLEATSYNGHPEDPREWEGICGYYYVQADSM